MQVQPPQILNPTPAQRKYDKIVEKYYPSTDRISKIQYVESLRETPSEHAEVATAQLVIELKKDLAIMLYLIGNNVISGDKKTYEMMLKQYDSYYKQTYFEPDMREKVRVRQAFEKGEKMMYQKLKTGNRIIPRENSTALSKPPKLTAQEKIEKLGIKYFGLVDDPTQGGKIAYFNSWKSGNRSQEEIDIRQGVLHHELEDFYEWIIQNRDKLTNTDGYIAKTFKAKQDVNADNLDKPFMKKKIEQRLAYEKGKAFAYNRLKMAGRLVKPS